MLYLLLYPLKDLFGPFRLFGYITFRSAYAAVFAILFTLLLGGRLIELLRRRSVAQCIREEVPERHKAKQGTPSMGGLIILAGLLLSVLLFADITNPAIIVLIAATVYFGLLGFWDDYVKIFKRKPRGISISQKLLFQSLFGLGLGCYLAFFGLDGDATKTNLIFVKNYVIDFGLIYPLFVWGVVLGTSNGVNLTDGLDGLAAGLICIGALAYAALAYASGHLVISRYLNILYLPHAGEVTVFCAALAGAGLGFLWFNTHPAQVFMGDTGSLSLGAIIGTAAILVKHEILLLLVGGVFVIESLSVLIQIAYFRRTGGKRFFKMAPLHHHYELSGIAEPKIVVRFWIVGIIFLMIALSTLKIR